MKLKEIRQLKGLTQKEASKILNVSLRSYKDYENSQEKMNTNKYDYLCEKLKKYGFVDETHGVLSVETIKDKVYKVFQDFDVEYCYLFGSYARGTQTEISDVDLLVSTQVTGLRFYGLAERLREEMNKKIDLLQIEQLSGNIELINNILKEGIKIYKK